MVRRLMIGQQRHDERDGIRARTPECRDNDLEDEVHVDLSDYLRPGRAGTAGGAPLLFQTSWAINQLPSGCRR
jgi:hypothetical protein